MIDFRYHLISIVAVFLALGVGVLMGSAFLGAPIKNGIKAQIKYVKSRNEALHTTNEDLSRRLEQSDKFALDAEPWLLNNRLLGRQVVVVTFEGTTDGLVSGAAQELEKAGATVVSTVTFTSKLALPDATARGELAHLLGTAPSDGDALRADLARRTGRELARSARSNSSAGGLDGFLTALAGDGFVTVEKQKARTAPPASLFVVIGGSPDPPPFDATAFTVALVKRLFEQPVIVAEPTETQWNLVGAVRSDGAARTSVSTEDAMDTPQGEIALTLGLLLEDDGVTGHYGVKAGAEDIIPKPLGG